MCGPLNYRDKFDATVENVDDLMRFFKPKIFDKLPGTLVVLDSEISRIAYQETEKPNGITGGEYGEKGTDMPRKARIDAAGALHHTIVHGIERRKIFCDDADRDSLFGLSTTEEPEEGKLHLRDYVEGAG